MRVMYKAARLSVLTFAPVCRTQQMSSDAAVAPSAEVELTNADLADGEEEDGGDEASIGITAATTTATTPTPTAPPTPRAPKRGASAASVVAAAAAAAAASRRSETPGSMPQYVLPKQTRPRTPACPSLSMCEPRGGHQEPPRTYDVNSRGLRRLHCIMLLAHLLGAGVQFATTTSKSMDGPAVTKPGNWHWPSPSDRVLFDPHVYWSSPIMQGVCAAYYLFVATCYSMHYERGVLAGYNRARWVQVALVYGLAVLSSSITAGISDIYTLWLILTCTIVGVMIIAMGESVGETKATKQQHAFRASVVDDSSDGNRRLSSIGGGDGRDSPSGDTMMIVGRLRPVPIWYTIVGTMAMVQPLAVVVVTLNALHGGGVAVPAWEDLTAITSIVLGVLIGANACLQQRRVGPWAKYSFGDQLLTVMLFAATTCFSTAAYLRPMHT